MKRYQLEQLRINNETQLSNMAMNIKVNAMEMSRKEVELRNERYLDSIGSGTTDKVRQAELAYNRGVLELEQLRQQYENEKKVKDAELKVKELLNSFNGGKSMTKNVHFSERRVLSLTGKGLKDKIDKVINPLDQGGKRG